MTPLRLYHTLKPDSDLRVGSSTPQAAAPAQTLSESNGAPQDATQKPAEPKHDSTRPRKKKTKTNTISSILNKGDTSKDDRHHGGEALHTPAGVQTQMTSPLDEDLNPNRRKRRKVSAGELDWGQQGLPNAKVGRPLVMIPNSGSSPSRQRPEETSTYGSDSISSEKYRSKARLCKLLPKPNQDLSVIEPFAAPDSVSTQGLPGEQANGIPQLSLLTPDSIKPLHSDTDLIESSNNEPAPQKKTLKLNPNGKLLTSPTANKPRSQSPGRKRGRRKTANKKSLTLVPPVIIRYPVDEARRASFGKTIDDICNGLTRYSPPKPSAPATSQNPSKPTHPFFLGKAVHQENKPLESPHQDQSSAASIPDNLNPTQPSKNSSPAVNIIPPNKANKLRPATFGSVFSQKPRISKGSGLVEALWPPRDFVHISATQVTVNPNLNSNANTLNNREKKGKNPLLGIPDSESILRPLSQLVHASRHENSTSTLPATNDILRRPERYVGDGQALQNLVVNELSFNCARQTPHETGSQNRILLPEKGCHPAVLRLASSIPSSCTAFDKGEFDVLPWTHKYAPCTSEDVLQPGIEVLMLRDWLRHLMVSTVDTGSTVKDGPKLKQNKPGRKAKRNKRLKMSDELDGFIVSSGDEASQREELTDPDEDELSGGVTFMSKRSLQPNNLNLNLTKGHGQMWNAVLISGPSGCGKTASVYAAAKELDFEVFELNAGSRRSAKDILERVGDMTQNHLVHKLKDPERATDSPGPNPDIAPTELDSGKQSRMNSFFVQKPTQERKTKVEENEKKKMEPEEPKRQKSQKQSLILLEEVDVLFEEDKQFWSGVLSLISQSKRPIIMTCRDEGLLPLRDLSFHMILRYAPPPCSLAADYMLLLAASEGHLLQRKAVSDLYVASNQDLRASVTELNFWCQMALGSEKSGIDWMIGNFRRPMSLHDRPRVISKNTYLSGMGWYSRDMACCQGDGAERDIAVMTQCVEQWPLQIMDWQETETSTMMAQVFDNSDSVDTQSDQNRLESLRRKSEFTEMQSVLEILCKPESKEVTNVSMHARNHLFPTLLT